MILKAWCHRRHVMTTLCCMAIAVAARAQPADEAQLPAVTVRAHYDNAVGTSDAASQGSVRRELLDSRPALRPAELLEFVPGVIVTQHSGDGKANQYFLRGFNLDHGTDFATSVDGMPVNMPTHAHGQGYTDLNFMIPELVERIDYRKGPYYSRTGDFGSAGAADIHYLRALPRPLGELTLGERGYRRVLLGGSKRTQGGITVLAALEGLGNDGPWVLPQNHRKVNGVLRLSEGTPKRGWQLSVMGFDANWDASDQVPRRAVESGLIPRYGTIDRTSGGETSRFSLSGRWQQRDAEGGVVASAYAMRYRLALFSNFTYALERPEQGDQFEQNDRRIVYGAALARDWQHRLAGREAQTEVGLQWRHDRITVGLFDTQARERSFTVREDRVRQSAFGLYGENTVTWSPWLRSVAGLRVDHHLFRVSSSLDANSGRAQDTQVSPKLSLIFGPWARTEMFVNAGRGFHSNDARGTTARQDPRSGEPVDTVPGLVASRGFELGLRTEALPGLQSSLALWRLDSRSELVYVGDAGTTEPNRPSTRNGVEWNNRWIPRPWLLVDADLAWTHARFKGAAAEGNRIPGAAERVGSVAVTLRELAGWSASLQWRYLGPRPLIEDNSERARSTLLTNLRITRAFGPRLQLGIDVFNLLDRRVNDIEYFYESRLPGEAAAVADRHVHPAEPRTVRVSLQARF